MSSSIAQLRSSFELRLIFMRLRISVIHDNMAAAIRVKLIILVVIILLCGIIYKMWPLHALNQALRALGNSTEQAALSALQATIATVACDNRTEEVLTLVKSLIIFASGARLKVIVFKDNTTEVQLGPELLALQKSAKNLNVELELDIRDSWFPDDNGEGKWRKWFGTCSTQRLFFPSLLPNETKLLYLDADTLLLSGVREMWETWDSMNDTHAAAMSAENEEPGNGYYDGFSKIPYYGSRGLNAGVMFMDLEAMRRLELEKSVFLIERGYRKDLVWADQDILNVYFHFHPHLLYLLPCHMNYRVMHCLPDWHNWSKNRNRLAVNCKSAESSGISILHGHRRSFFAENFTATIYKAFREYNLEVDQPINLLKRLKGDFLALKAKKLPCTFMDPDLVFRRVQEYINAINVVSPA